MAIPGRIEEALIQHRFGFSADLPDYLEEAEIAFTVDEGGVFIGAPMFKRIDGRERHLSNIYPYHNIQILTEVSDNAEIIKVPYNPFNSAMNMPIVLIACSEPTITNTDIITVNGIRININARDTTLKSYVSTFNAQLKTANVDNIAFDIYNNKFRITFYAKDNETLILDSITEQALQHFGFVNAQDTNVIHKVVTPTKTSNRSLQEILSDKITIKTFGVVNNDNDDCSLITNSVFFMLYKQNKEFLKKELFFPAGNYRYKTDSINLTSDVNMVGEGNTTLIFENNLKTNYMIANLDSLGFPPSIDRFSVNPAQLYNINVDKFNFYSDTALNGFYLSGVNDFNLKNSSIKSEGEYGFKIYTTNTFKRMKNIFLENISFDGFKEAINIDSTDNIIIKNCSFKNISNKAVILKQCNNVIFDGCDFSDSSVKSIATITNCTNVKFKNCIYPNGFGFLDGTNNKILVTNSFVDIEDYITATIEDGITNIIKVPMSNSKEEFVLKLDYDIYGRNFQDRSGHFIKKLLANGSTSLNDINDSNEDTSCQFSLTQSGKTFILSLNNLYSAEGFIRYKISFLPISKK